MLTRDPLWQTYLQTVRSGLPFKVTLMADEGNAQVVVRADLKLDKAESSPRATPRIGSEPWNFQSTKDCDTAFEIEKKIPALAGHFEIPLISKLIELS